MLASFPRSSTKANRVLPRLELLEDRLVPAITGMAAVSQPLTDMTAVAQLFKPHSGPTKLYLNFDGASLLGVTPFQSTTGDLTRDIHEIMYRVAEIYAPFNVQVQRWYGNGSYDTSSNGNTTVFIGDNNANGTGTANLAHAYTPDYASDHPGEFKGIDHQPNSDPYDIAFVDPVSYSGGNLVSRDNATIAQNIAHEAGHTFGLWHVLSAPDEEVMSYDDTNARFVNKTFNITDLNSNGDGTGASHHPELVPEWYVLSGGIEQPVTITTQNSYTYLMAVLGPRSTDYANVADATAVDPGYVDGTLTKVVIGSDLLSSVQQTGDYDVYSLSVDRQLVKVEVKQATGSYLDPVVMVFSGDGQTLLSFNDDGGNGWQNSWVNLIAGPGQSYKVVVGSFSNFSTGTYELVVSNPLTYSSTSTSAVLTSAPLSGSTPITTTAAQQASDGGGQKQGTTGGLLPGTGSPPAPGKTLTGLADPTLGSVQGSTDLSGALDQVFGSGHDPLTLHH